MAAVIGCVMRSAARHGFERIFVLNGHGGNIAALDTIITELTIALKLPLAGGTYWYIATESIRGILEHQPQLLHACEAETSIMQALSPELVAPLEPMLIPADGRKSTQSRPFVTTCGPAATYFAIRVIELGIC